MSDRYDIADLELVQGSLERGGFDTLAESVLRAVVAMRVYDRRITELTDAIETVLPAIENGTMTIEDVYDVLRRAVLGEDT